MKKLYVIYKFTNTITGDFYIGSRNKIKKSLTNQKYQSVWIAIPNDQLYKDIEKYGIDKFELEILEEVEANELKEVEQQFIELLKPTYNQMNAKDSIIEKLESLPAEIKKTDKWKLAMAIAIDNGSAYYDDMYEAVDCYLHLGFTPEEICEQINFGSLNVNEGEIKRLFNI